mgnify:CR=1 FL=1
MNDDLNYNQLDLIDTEELFNLFSDFQSYLKDKTIKIDDSVFSISFEYKSNDEHESVCMILNDFNYKLLSIEVINFNEFYFKYNVKQPFAWDGSDRERYAKQQFEYFLSENNLFKPFQLNINYLDKKLSFNELDLDNNIELEKILKSINFDQLLDSLKTSSYTIDNNNKNLNIKL